jgi:4-amino-4-deoxy-L-arabinose transferase-like glycosyltransferase
MKNYLFLFLAWLLLWFFASPLGEFPLNDDWSYSATVKHFCDTGEYVSGDTPAMTLFGHVLWGSLFVKIFGFSFSILRLSGNIAGLIGIFFSYRLCNYLFNNKNLALFFALTLLVNPIYFALSNSFMTDIPFFSSCVITSYFLLRYFKEQRNKYLFLGILFSCFGMLIRQTAIIIPAAFAIMMIVENPRSVRIWLSAGLPVSCAGLTLIIFTWYMRHYNHLSWAFQDRGQVYEYFHHPKLLLLNFIFRVTHILLFAGLFLFPLTLFRVKNIVNAAFKTKIVFGISLLAFVTALIQVLPTFPKGNIFNEYGIGPITTYDVLAIHINSPEPLSAIFTWPLRIIAVTGAINLLFIFSERITAEVFVIREKSFSKFISVFALLSLCLFSFMVSLPDFFFDRYLLFTLPFFALIALNGCHPKKRAYVFSSVLIGLLFFFTAFTVRDYFEWSRTRWQFANAVVKSGVSPMDLEGGYEFNGWHAYTDEKKWERDITWHQRKKKFMISSGAVESYSKVDSVIVPATFGSRKLYILQAK